MQTLWRVALSGVVALSLSGAAQAGSADDILGVWLTAEGKSKVEIYRCGQKYCGKIAWLKEPNFPPDDDKEYAGKTKVDRHNPDAQRRRDPLLGKEILKNLAFEDAGEWRDGEIYDPKNGKTYSCKATLTAPNALEMRGFIGFSLLGRTAVWTR